MSNIVEAPVATVVQGHTFTISKRYEPKKILGRGSFGVVTTAFDSVRKENIAIKRIRPYANDEWDARHTLREVRLMKVLGAHPNIISLFDLSLFDEKSELYMYMELMDCDLHRIIQSKQPLNDTHYKCFAKQMLEGVKAMHSIGIFHRDLKPGNILVSKDCQLRITDFGLARFMDEVTLAGDNRQNPMTEYVVTRWYRCPELLLAPKEPYSCAIDIWSIGCIIGELIKRKPLFPGKSHANQVQLILEVKGYRSPADLGVTLTSEASSFLDRRCKYNGQSLASFIPQASPAAIELLTGLLQLNPALRPTAAEALAKPYMLDAQVLSDYSNPSNQPRQIDESFFDFERNVYSIEALREMIRDEVKSYKNRPTSSGSVRTGALSSSTSPSTTSAQKAVTPPSDKKAEMNVIERQISGERVERQMSAGVERSSGPYSQAPTAARGRQMSNSNLGPSDDRVAFNKRELENADGDDEDFRELNGQYSTTSVGDGHGSAIGITATGSERDNSENHGLVRSGSNGLDIDANGEARKSSSRKAPPTPSPGKMQSIAKQERKQKRIFYLQSMQRKQVEGGGAEEDVMSTSTGGIQRKSNINANSVANIRSGGIGYGTNGGSGKFKTQISNNAAVPPLPVEMASATADNGDLSQLFNQFQSSSFSARERRETLPADNQMIKYSGRQLASAPDINNRNSRFPSLRGSSKQPPGRL